MCSADANGSDCQSLPRGALNFRTFVFKPGLIGVIESLKDAPRNYRTESATYSYPRSLQGAKAQGCYLRIYEDKKVVLGFDQDRLQESSLCLVAFERYLARNKNMLLR